MLEPVLRYTRLAPYLLLVSVAMACGAKRDSSATPDTATSKPQSPTASQGGRISEVETRLAAFLEGSLETSPPIETNALMACVPDGQTDRYVTLARYQILNSALRGDSADAAAEVVTVAEEVGYPHAAEKYAATVRIRTDTLHWVMTRDSASAKWGVCGYPKEGLGFGHYGDDRNTRWNLPGGSWSRVRQLAESLHVHRGQ